MRLLLVRHGETESNRLGLALGREDVPLNERGRWQAKRSGETLAREAITAVYSSPLQRALDTARAIAAAHSLEVQMDPGLTEMDIGQAEGLTFAAVRDRYPGLLEAWVSVDGPTMAMPGGERLVDVLERAWGSLQAMAERHPEGTVAAVTHNFVILSALSRVLGLELAHFRRLRHGVGAISELEFKRDRWRLVRLNDGCHLED